MAGVNLAAGKVSSKSVFGGQFGGGEKFGCGKSVFEKRLREVIRWRGEIRLREKCLRKASSRGNSVAEGNSAAGKVSSPDHIDVSSKKVFGGARKSATRNACAMYKHLNTPEVAMVKQPTLEYSTEIHLAVLLTELYGKMQRWHHLPMKICVDLAEMAS